MISFQTDLQLTVAEVAAALRLDRNSVYKMLKDGTIQGVRIGRTWRIPRAFVDILLNHGTHTRRRLK